MQINVVSSSSCSLLIVKSWNSSYYICLFLLLPSPTTKPYKITALPLFFFLLCSEPVFILPIPTRCGTALNQTRNISRK